MKITLLASDEATAPLYRVRMLARILARYCDVEVLGFQFHPEGVDPEAPRDFPYLGVVAHPGRRFYQDARFLAQQVSGDLLYAMKPRFTSFGLAMALRSQRHLPVVVDVDDAELAMVSPYSRHALKNAWHALGRLRDPNNYLLTWGMDQFVRAADGVTTVSRHFQRKYGGIRVPQFVDTAIFDPARYDPQALREALGLQPYKLCVFLGIAQPNKGVGDILAAFQSLGDRSDWRLLIIGPQTPYGRQLAESDPRVVLLGTCKPKDAPAYLALADLVVLPQRDEPASIGQMPMKLYEAMAMACPVISTRVADIPEVLSGCGRIVSPGNQQALGRAISWMIDHPEEARGFGKAARCRILSEFSYDRGAELLGGFLERKLNPRARRVPC